MRTPVAASTVLVWSLTAGAAAATEPDQASGWRLLRAGATLDSLALWLMFGEGLRPPAAGSTGSHIWRPGDDATRVARRYLGGDASGASLATWNPELGSHEPGERVQVPLARGLPADGALLRRLSGRVDTLPAPVPWLDGRPLDLLAAGDGVRTSGSGSAELELADATRLLVSEDSLVFLRPTPELAAVGPIEVVGGQLDLRREPGAPAGVDGGEVELVLGEVGARARPGDGGGLAARARRSALGEVQILVFRGAGDVTAHGVTVRAPAGTGVRVAAGAPPSPPERLLPAPALLEPSPGTITSQTALVFRWREVEGAAAYTFELCRDPDCAELVERELGVREPELRVAALANGRTFWRVTAEAPSGLDGFPSASAELSIDAPVVAATASAIVGRLYAGSRSIPLAGAELLVLELGRSAKSTADGRFALADVPPGRYTLEAWIGGRAVGRLEEVPVEAGRTTEVALVSEALVVAHDEIVVRPSRVALLAEAPVAPLAVDRDDMMALPHLGDDLFRALPMLPGTAANDVSAEIHVRGGRRDELQILLDGQELYEPFHLVDYDNALSVVAPSVLESVTLTTGGWQVENGDRMAGVLDMRTTALPAERRSRLGASVLTLQGGSGGALPKDGGHFLLQGRFGSTELVRRLFDREDPTYWDLFAKAERQLSARQTLRAHALLTGDELDFSEVLEEESKRRHTDLAGVYLWLHHGAWLAGKAAVETTFGWSRSSGDRRAEDDEPEQHLVVDDHHRLDVGELRQAWDLAANEGHLFSWGLGARRFRARYDYFSFKEYSTPIHLLRPEPRDGELRFADTLDGDHTSAYVKDRWRLAEALILELGLRYDRHSWLDEEHLSPRLNLGWSLGGGGVLRLAWGRFLQGQRPQELEVEDGETAFAAVERSEQFLLGYEHVVAGGSRLAGLSFRAEAFRRRIANPRVRYENLFEPFNNFPELEPDRVRIAPERSRAEGFELFVRGPRRYPVDWWLSYGYSAVEDRLDGRWAPRRIDQTHALSVNLNVPLGARWRLDLAWRYHTGWPTTPIELVEVVPGKEDEGEDPDDEPGDPDDPGGEDPGMEEPEEPEPILVPVLGPLNSRRLSSYHRLDLRASREIAVRRGRLIFFVDVQNVYDRRNASGFDLAVDDETGTLEREREDWPGILPSLGLEWDF